MALHGYHAKWSDWAGRTDEVDRANYWLGRDEWVRQEYRYGRRAMYLLLRVAATDGAGWRLACGRILGAMVAELKRGAISEYWYMGAKSALRGYELREWKRNH